MSFPRMRGGGPPGPDQYHPRDGLFPACAGVVPLTKKSRVTGMTFPRMRGGGPRQCSTKKSMHSFSPHARGWSLRLSRRNTRKRLFPACAGVVLQHEQKTSDRSTFPRMRGGGPNTAQVLNNMQHFSPHARGWSQAVLNQEIYAQLFPACAGVVPRTVTAQNPKSAFPRMRGGGPIAFGVSCIFQSFSPHARGWSQPSTNSGKLSQLFPACAGVVPAAQHQSSIRDAFPRMRGGGP